MSEEANYVEQIEIEKYNKKIEKLIKEHEKKRPLDYREVLNPERMTRIKTVEISRKLRKRQEKMTINISRFTNQQVKLKLKDADRPTKRQKVSQQIQRGFDIAKKWSEEHE